MANVVYKVGDDISTDVIYPGRFMATVLPNETPLLAFADDAAFSAKLKSKPSARMNTGPSKPSCRPRRAKTSRRV